MRLEGKTLPAIAAELGISKQGVHQAVERAIARRIDLGADDAAELRLKQVTEIALVIHELWPRRDDPAVVDRLVKLWDRQAKLCGLDAAFIIEHRVPTRPGSVEELEQRRDAAMTAIRELNETIEAEKAKRGAVN